MNILRVSMCIQQRYSMGNNRFILIGFIALWFLSGCSLTPLPNPSTVETDQKVAQLTGMLVALDQTVDPKEAQDLARTSIVYAKELSQRYEVVSPPLWHNTLVNMGFKKRGLCYEWAEDLLEYLLNRHYQTLQFYTIGANVGSYFEHNALSVAAKGEGYESGVVLDAWRHSGDLFFSYLKNDTKYAWENRKILYQTIFAKTHH